MRTHTRAVIRKSNDNNTLQRLQLQIGGQKIIFVIRVARTKVDKKTITFGMVACTNWRTKNDILKYGYNYNSGQK